MDDLVSIFELTICGKPHRDNKQQQCGDSMLRVRTIERGWPPYRKRHEQMITQVSKLLHLFLGWEMNEAMDCPSYS